MRLLMLICLLAFSSSVFAEERNWDYAVDVTLASKHFCGCPDVNNERNWGLGTTIDFNNNWEMKLGGYKNSYSKASYYALANYYREWSPREDWIMRAGIAAGFVTGYYGTGGHNKALAFLDERVQLGAIPTLTVGYKRTRVVFGLPGPVFTLQLQYLLD